MSKSIKFIKLKEVIDLTELSRSSVYRLMKSGNFPKQRKLSPQGRASRWIESEVLEWMSACEIAE